MKTHLHNLRTQIGLICFCIFATLPVLLPLLVTGPLTVKSVAPWEEQEDMGEEELVADPVVRNRTGEARKTDFSKRVGVVEFLKPASTTRRHSAIVGHKFSNGLRAPLMT